MNIKNPLLLIMLLASTMLSCSDDDNVAASNPNEQTALRVVFAIGNNGSSDSGRIIKDRARNLTELIEFSGGYIVADEIEFEGELNDVDDEVDDDRADDEIELEFDFEDGARFDFGSDFSSSELLINIPQGIYDEFSIEIDLDDDGDEPSLVLTGSFMEDELSVPIVFQFKGDDFDFEIEDDNVEVNALNSSIALIQLYPSKWFSSISEQQLSNASRTEEGEIIISKTTNTNIYNIVEENMERLSDFQLR